jgi:hypothetical protein
VGYISNLLAKFWFAPYLGAMLERDLLDPEAGSSLNSRFGMTDALHEPNEWGWFWQYWLGIDEGESYCRDSAVVDSPGFLSKIAALEAVKKAPLIFDNVYASANFPILEAILPRTVIIRLRRDPYYICNSHINARIDRYGDIGCFYGIRPRNIGEILRLDDPVEQVVVQVKSVIEEMNETLARVPQANILTIDYETFVEDPPALVEDYVRLLAAQGVNIKRKGNPPPPSFRNRNDPELIRPEVRDRLDTLFSKHFASSPAS